MAKYVIVPDKHEKIEKNYVFPFINIVPAVVWSIPIHQKLFPKAGFWIVAFYTVAFIALYLYVSLKPFIAVAPCIAGVVIYTLTAWIPLNHIGNNIVRIILKGIALIIVRRHIVGGENRTLISVKAPLRLCRTGTCRRLSAV